MTDFTWYLRNLLLVQSSDDMEEVLDMLRKILLFLKRRSKNGRSRDTVSLYSYIFSELSNQVKYSSQKRILIEIALIKLCRPQMERDEASVLERISRIEKDVRRRNPGGISTDTKQQCSGEDSRKQSP